MNFFIDPYAFSFDKEKITKKQLEEFIENLIDWKKLIDLNWGSVFKPIETFDILFKHNLFPYIDTLKELVDKYNIDYIQPEEIDKIVNAILNKLPHIEDHCEIFDILIDKDNFSDIENRNEDFIYLLKKIATILKIDCILNKKNNNENIIISNGLKDPLIKFDALISLIDSKHQIDLPLAINVEFFHFCNFKLFCSKIEPAIIVMNAQSDMCIKMAVYIKLFQVDPSCDYIYEEKTPNFVLHESFFQSLRNLNFHIDESKINLLLRSLYEEVLNINMKDTHELREGKSGGSNQISHKGYLGWRRDIDYEYHLHYWRKGEELIFTDVVPHNNFKITKV
jgi:hypothetical protein